jgi:DNA-binding SARP family transcriptional activator
MLRLFLFGSVRIDHDGHGQTKLTHTLQSVLAYLVLQGKVNHARESVAGLVWGDHSQNHARNCLNTALWRLRRALEPRGISPGTYLVSEPGGEIGFNWNSPHWLDVETFEKEATRLLAVPPNSMTDKHAEQMAFALSLYTGDLLDGFYEEWVLRERERLRLLDLKSLAHLAQYYRHRRAFEQSIACCQKILLHDPLREEIHRELMRLYLLSGQRALAVRQYEICRQVLEKELAIPPMEETLRLYQHLVSGGADRAQETEVVATDSMSSALEDLHQAAHELDRARARLQFAVERFERMAVHPERSRQHK